MRFCGHALESMGATIVESRDVAVPVEPRKSNQPSLSMRDVHQVVKDLFQPNPAIYWADFLLSFFVGLAAYLAVLRMPPLSWQQVGCYLVSIILFYRSALFIHEIVHFRDSAMKSFRFVWNLFCGIPFMMPTFTYYTHSDHHIRKHFATHQDGEYLPLAAQSPIYLFFYLCQPFFMPILAVGRFMFLTPLSYFSPAIRKFAHERASSMVIDLRYMRPLPSRRVLRIMRFQEACCCLICWGFAYMLLFHHGQEFGRIQFKLTYWNLVQVYATSVGILMLNHVRTLGAHRYTNLERREMTFIEQLLDSVNYPHYAWLAELAMPVGLRFHALHHLCPALPYHNLGKAHRKLMQELPADSIYRQTVSPSLKTAIWQVVRSSWRTRGIPPAASKLAH
jgi:fatty acid desaturase